MDLPNFLDELESWLAQQLTPQSWHWLEGKRQQIASTRNKRNLLLSFSAIPRYLEPVPLELAERDWSAIASWEEWNPKRWNLQQIGRIFLVLSFPWDPPEDYARALEQLFAVADGNELVTLYQSLPLLPHRDRYGNLAKEGVRSNMTSVFEAIALRNSYPARYFDESAWNQLVIKALFVGSPLHLIWGLDRRLNPELARIAIDYARERRAAGRSVSWELWRLLGSYGDTAMIRDLKITLETGDRQEKEAAALACFLSTCQPVRELLSPYPDLQNRIQKAELTWDGLTLQLDRSTNT